LFDWKSVPVRQALLHAGNRLARGARRALGGLQLEPPDGLGTNGGEHSLGGLLLLWRAGLQQALGVRNEGAEIVIRHTGQLLDEIHRHGAFLL